MNSFWDGLSDTFRWVPDRQSGIYICILAVLILSRRTRLTLIFLFASAYIWGIAFFSRPDAPEGYHLLRSVYTVAGLIIIAATSYYFLTKKSA